MSFGKPRSWDAENRPVNIHWILNLYGWRQSHRKSWRGVVSISVANLGSLPDTTSPTASGSGRALGATFDIFLPRSSVLAIRDQCAFRKGHECRMHGQPTARQSTCSGRAGVAPGGWPSKSPEDQLAFVNCCATRSCETGSGATHPRPSTVLQSGTGIELTKASSSSLSPNTRLT